MSEAPKKIWYSFEYEKRIIAGANEEDTPYIRADLVDGLVEALKEVDYVLDIFSAFGQSDLQRKVQAALKALEEE